MRERLARSPAAAAALLYLVLALALTWPLPAGLTRDLPWDLGDPVLNCALLERNAQRLLAALSGDLGALRGFWDARIFHPEPRTLAYSEHLFAQTLQALPVYALTGNILLSYNLLFLSSFVLSALGAFLLARDVLGRDEPALMAGLLYGFALYRVEQFSHLQVLSSQWMPFAIWGLRRHLGTGRLLPLAGSALALVAQNLSCGYYLLYFAPLFALLAVLELLRRGRLRDGARWAPLLGAGAAAALLTLPFVWPYLQVRQSGEIVRERAEVELFSADVYAYLTAPEDLRLWGDVLRAHPAPEGQLFPGLVPVLLAAAALLLPLRGALSAGREPPLARLFCAAAALAALGGLVIVAGAGGPVSTLVPGVSIRSLPRALFLLALALGALLLASPRWRALALLAIRSTRGLLALGLALALLLSCGPTLRSLGRPLMAGPYLWLYEHVPGFDGLRVPARWAMIATLFLSLLAGIGAAELQARLRRGRAWLIACGALFVLEACAAPLVVNDVWSDPALRRPPPRLTLGAQSPPIYRHAAGLPRSAVLIEFPFGSDPYELRYMFHQPLHGLPLVNGFSGARPRSYARARGPLRNLLAEPEPAARALAATTATHAIVHEGAWGIPAKGRRVTRWLEEQGAAPLASEGGDVLLVLKR